MKKLIVANWKANKSLLEAQDWLNHFLTDENLSMIDPEKKEVILAPAHFLLSTVAKFSSRASNLNLAVQDLSPYPAGSYTGAISAENLNGLNVKYALLGHSERRRYFSETCQQVAKKVELALAAEIQPIICLDLDYLDEQAAALTEAHFKKCMVAYEPLTAIGSGRNETTSEVAKAVKKIKRVFGSVPVLYGGSVTADNVADYRKVVDGVLVGGASLQAANFIDLIQQV